MKSRDSVFEALSSLIDCKELVDKSVLVFTHRQADPDALCAAFALSRYLESVRNKQDSAVSLTRIIVPQGSSLLGNRISKALGIGFDLEIKEEDIASAALIVAVDVGDTSLLDPFADAIKRSKAAKFLIDHHSIAKIPNEQVEKERSLFDQRFVEEKATSTCEILAQGYPPEKLDKKTAQALLVGLLFDSQHLGIATYWTLEAALKLVKAGARIDESKEILRSSPDRSETIAKLKAAQRLTFLEIKKYLIVQSEVSSFQAAVARMLVDIGSDVAIAFGEQDGEARVSVRTTQRFFRETGIDMGELLGSLSVQMSLAGGGHASAASISGMKEPNEILEKIVAEIKRRLL